MVNILIKNVKKGENEPSLEKVHVNIDNKDIDSFVKIDYNDVDKINN